VSRPFHGVIAEIENGSKSEIKKAATLSGLDSPNAA